MSALGEAQARIASIRKLKIVVGAMRGIAATHTQQARNALDGFRAYTKVISGGLARAVELLAPEGLANAPPAESPGASWCSPPNTALPAPSPSACWTTVLDDENAKLFVVGDAGLGAGGAAGTARRLVDADGEPGLRRRRDRPPRG